MKKLSIIIIFILSFGLLIGNVDAKSVEELIKEQNPSQLNTDDYVNMECQYATNNDKDYFGEAKKNKRDIKKVIYKIKYDENEKKHNLSHNKVNTSSITYTSLREDSFISQKVYYCPEKIYGVAREIVTGTVTAGGIDRNQYGTNWSFTTTKPGKDYAIFYLGETSISGTRANGDSIGNYYPGIKETKYVCGGMVSDDLLKEINKIYKTISLLVVAIVIILGILDFIKAVSSDDDAALKKAAIKFMKRILIAVVIVILPILLQFILDIFGDENMKQCLDKIK